MRKPGLIFVVLYLCTAVLSAGASYKARVPHWVELVCEEGTGGYTGYWGLTLHWNAYPEASGYEIISLHGALGGGSVGPETTEWGIMGGSPVAPGACGQIYIDNNPYWFQSLYQVWATFPDGGTVELTKTDNVYGMVHPGDEIRYFLIYKNTGKYPVYDCIVEESWPAYMEYVAGGNPSGSNTVTWSFGTLMPGQWHQVELVLKVSENLPRSVTEIYNVAVAHPDPSPSPTPTGALPPTGISPVSGIGVSFCDALRCNMVYGDAQWIDYPDSTTFADLMPYDMVRGGDEVVLNSGYTSFNHTVPTGVLTLLAGGFTLTPCPDLDDTVMSEIILDVPSSVEHGVSGILADDDHVKVVSQFLTIEIHDGKYTLEGESDRETLTVEAGRVTVIDPDGKEHDLSAGTVFTWPDIGTGGAIDNGPVLTGTDPADFESVPLGGVVLNYQFDSPVDSIGAGSSLCIGETEGLWQSGDTLENLITDGKISMEWNAGNDILTITVPDQYPWTGVYFEGGMTLIAALNLEDVQGASGTTPSVTETLTVYLTHNTSSLGWIICEYENFAFITQGNDLLEPNKGFEFRQLMEFPGAPPEGLYPVSPAYEFHFEGSIVSHYWLQLKPTTKWGLPMGSRGGGIYCWNGSQWEASGTGFGNDWCWTGNLTDPDQTIALFTTVQRPGIPEVLSISPSLTDGPVAADAPIAIQVKSGAGVRGELSDIRINGHRTLSYEPSSGEYTGWTVEYDDDITTFTYTPQTPWQEAQLVYGSYHLPAHFGLIPAHGDFAFLVESTSTADGDGDGLPDAWEEANGTDPGTGDANNDPDGDGFSNMTEFTYWSNPSSSASLPAYPGIEILANQESYFERDTMVISTRVTNGPVETPVDLWVMLEVFGGYYFWPTYSIEPYPMGFTMPPNIDVTFPLFEYTWDSIPQPFDLTWYGAFLEPQTMMLYSLDMLTVRLDL